MNQAERFEQAAKITRLGMVANALLAVFKMSAGILGNSQAMIADAVESLADLVSTAVVLISLRVSKKPVDLDHPYGHGRAESIATGFVALIIAAAGVLILWRASVSIGRGQLTQPGVFALLAVIVVIVAKEALYQGVARLARRLESSLLMANALDHRKDALTSVATLLGIAGARMGYPLLDPLAAGLVGLVIFRLAYNVANQAANELMDRAPEDQTIQNISRIADGLDGVAHAEVRARRLGPNVFVDLKIAVDPNLTVDQGHTIAKQVKENIMEQVDSVSDVMVHINPHIH